MTETHIGEILVKLGVLCALAYLLAGILSRVRIPGIRGALLNTLAVSHTALGDRLLSPEIFDPLTLLAQLGVLLFFSGLSGDVPWPCRLAIMKPA
jgi:Kef-type K+ transport system membrane component KefB